MSKDGSTFSNFFTVINDAVFYEYSCLCKLGNAFMNTAITLGSEKVVSVCIQASSLEKVIWLTAGSEPVIGYFYFCRCELLNWAKWQSYRKAACSANLEEQEQTSYLYNCVFRAQIYIFFPPPSAASQTMT